MNCCRLKKVLLIQMHFGGFWDAKFFINVKSEKSQMIPKNDIRKLTFHNLDFREITDKYQKHSRADPARS